MDDLLTTRQLQELLHVDRVTIYRMLKDGRLKGVKIGKQWRFHRREVDTLISDAPSAKIADAPSSLPSAPVAVDIPFSCAQTIQDVFAEIAGVGSIVINSNGKPLTVPSNCGHFCNLILNSASGQQACVNSWRKLAAQPGTYPKFATCHAGLQCAHVRIKGDSSIEGVWISGQFYIEPPEADEEQARIQQLAKKHGLDAEILAAAAQRIPVLDDYKRARIGDWLEKVAHALEKIGRERADMMNRLRHIAEVSTF